MTWFPQDSDRNRKGLIIFLPRLQELWRSYADRIDHLGRDMWRDDSLPIETRENGAGIPEPTAPVERDDTGVLRMDPQPAVPAAHVPDAEAEAEPDAEAESETGSVSESGYRPTVKQLPEEEKAKEEEEDKPERPRDEVTIPEVPGRGTDGTVESKPQADGGQPELRQPWKQSTRAPSTGIKGSWERNRKPWFTGSR